MDADGTTLDKLSERSKVDWQESDTLRWKRRVSFASVPTTSAGTPLITLIPLSMAVARQAETEVSDDVTMTRKLTVREAIRVREMTRRLEGKPPVRRWQRLWWCVLGYLGLLTRDHYQE